MKNKSGPMPHAASLVLAALSFLSMIPLAAHADAGVDVSASSSREEFTYPSGWRVTSAQKITVTPWWEKDAWRVAASLPLISREEDFSGTFLVWRVINRRLVQVPVTLTGNESDAGLGDASVRMTHTWPLREKLSTYISGYVKLPTGDDQAGAISVASAQASTTRQGGYSLGTGSTDFGVMQGLDFSSEKIWAALEAGYIVSNGGAAPQADRPMAYAGIGLTPASFIELSVAFDYEGELSAGSGELQQVTYSVTLIPAKHLALTLSTYDDNSSTTPDSNWSLGAAVNW